MDALLAWTRDICSESIPKTPVSGTRGTGAGRSNAVPPAGYLCPIALSPVPRQKGANRIATGSAAPKTASGPRRLVSTVSTCGSVYIRRNIFQNCGAAGRKTLASALARLGAWEDHVN
jgi:hypothetical protein